MNNVPPLKAVHMKSVPDHHAQLFDTHTHYSCDYETGTVKKVPPLKIVHMKYVPRTTRKDEPDANMSDFMQSFDEAVEFNAELKVLFYVFVGRVVRYFSFSVFFFLVQSTLTKLI